MQRLIFIFVFKKTIVMRKLIILFILNIVLCNLAVTQDYNNDSVTIKITDILERLKVEYNLPSVVLTIVHDKDIIYKNALGYTDLESKIVATTASRYPIMSISKLFAALAFVQMTEQGKIGLNDDVSTYVPDYKTKSHSNGEHKTSLLQLATHESGLPKDCPANAKFLLSHYQFTETFGKTPLINPCSEKEFIQSLQNIELEHEPYEYQQYSSYYSNVGFELLGIALESASGVDYAKYMEDNIFAPLAMNNTGFVQSNLDRKKLDLPQGYIYNKTSCNHIKTPYLLTGSYYHCAGMYSNSEDLAKFLISQLDYDSCYSNQILSPDGLRMMRKLNIGWNFKWFPEYPMIEHGGSYLGYRSYIALIPELKLGWIILSNQYDFKNFINLHKLDRNLRELLIPFTENDENNIKEFVKLEKFVGTYYVADKSEQIDLFIENDTLRYANEIYNTKNNTLIRQSNFRFEENAGFKYSFTFSTTDNEKIIRFKMGDLIWHKE